MLNRVSTMNSLDVKIDKIVKRNIIKMIRKYELQDKSELEN